MFKCIWSLLLLPNYKVKNPWMWWYVSSVFLCSTSVLLYLYTIFWLLLFVSWQRRGPVRWWCRKRRFPEMWVCDSVDFMSAQQAWQKHLLMVSLCPAGKDMPHQWLLCNWNDRWQSKQSKQWWVDIVLDYLLVQCLTSLLGRVIVSMPTCTISRSPFFLLSYFVFLVFHCVFTPAVPYEAALLLLPGMLDPWLHAVPFCFAPDVLSDGLLTFWSKLVKFVLCCIRVTYEGHLIV